MTAEEHNKYLGYAHIAYAVFHSLMGVFMSFMMLAMVGTLPDSGRGNPPPPGFFMFIGLFVALFTVGWSVPSMLAAYAFLKKKRWAKVAGVVAGVFAATQMPVGTAVCVYTFWFLFGEKGKQLYEQPAHELPPAPPTDWASVNRQPEQMHQPHLAPPDWR